MLRHDRFTTRSSLQRACAYKMSRQRRHLDLHGSFRLLAHHTCLPVAIGILLRIELVHEAGLLVLTSARLGGAEAVAAVAAGQVVSSTTRGASAGQVICRAVVVGVGTAQVGGTSLEASGAHGGGRLSAAADLARLALETVVTLLTAAENTALLLEVVHADRGQRGGCMVLGGVVVNLMNGHSGVHNVGLDNLLVHDWLNGLMHVVVDVLACNDRSDGVRLLPLNALPLIPKLSLLGCETLLNLLRAVVLELTVLDGNNVVVVLLRELLGIEHRLHRGVVVILVNLLVDGGLNLLVLHTVDGLVGYGRGDLLVDGGVMVTSLGHEVLNGSLGGVHIDE